ncbi:sensor histidine kinase [Streptomonospora nanhaiensis]|uniref:sensor histidine kinase n=1 Tax=Streptomonospora nanhaiensis TaxID=1323731 RepID=UPI0027E36A5A|nr:ATP-binding protein [Streptomonospora nanhaiensis]
MTTTDDSRSARPGSLRRLLRRLGFGRAPEPEPARPAPRAAIAPAPPRPEPAPARQRAGAPGHAAPAPAYSVYNGAHAGAAYVSGPPSGRHAAEAAPPPPAGHEPDPALLTDALAGLAVRDLTMVESLLDIVGALEDSTEDPDLLAKLFEIDNLATRMRRNGENLLVLADQESDDSGMEPVALLDVARAATSEIKNYSRVHLGRLPEKYVAGEAADDISHLLAELLDNATNHSPDHSQVVISGQLMADGGLLLVVEDEGIGIPPEQLADLNARLAGTPILDKRVIRHMGLYVASRIAHRHGLRVQLEARAFRGLNAYTVIPANLITAYGPRPEPVVPGPSRMMPALAPQPTGHAAPPPGGPRRNGGTSAVTAAGLPRRSAAHAAPLRVLPTPAQDPPAPAGGGQGRDRAERIRDDLDGFLEGERAATRDTNRAE